MSNNINNPGHFNYGDRSAPPSDPYQFYRPEPTAQKKKVTLPIPKTLLPFILAACGTFLVYCWFPPRGFVSFYLKDFGIPYSIFILAVGAVESFLVCKWIKHKVVASSPVDLTMVQANLSEFPGLDALEFERYTAELESLGFVMQVDFKTQTAKCGFPAGVARLMLNSEQRCFAEINQINNKGELMPVRCALMSYSLRQVNGRSAIRWMVSTTNRAPMSAGWATRHPWSYGDSLPDAGPAQLFEHHRARRAGVTGQTGMGVSDDISVQTFFTLLQQSIIDRRQLIKKKNILLMLFQIDLFEFRPKFSWAGTPTKD